MGGLTPAQHSSDFHYVWQLFGLCVLEGPACVLAGVGRSAASLPPSFPPSVCPSVSLRNRGRGRAEPYPCPRVCLLSLSLFFPLSPSPPSSSSLAPALRSRPWLLFRNQRGSFWLGQENQGPGRRGGHCRKPNTMTIYHELGEGVGKSLSLLPTPPPPPILGPISWSLGPARAEAAVCGPCPVWKPLGSFCFLPRSPFP